jgi:hypothetical protein
METILFPIIHYCDFNKLISQFSEILMYTEWVSEPSTEEQEEE